MASSSFHLKFQDLQKQAVSNSCDLCDLNFQNSVEYLEHVEDKHRETESGGSQEYEESPCFSSGGTVKDYNYYYNDWGR